MQALLLCLILVPAPQGTPRDAAPFPIGGWDCSWGACEQDMWFSPEGYYYSERFGGGYWHLDRDGYLWFTERNDTAPYVMRLNPKTLEGKGWSRNKATGELSGEVRVILKPKGR